MPSLGLQARHQRQLQFSAQTAFNVPNARKSFKAATHAKLILTVINSTHYYYLQFLLFTHAQAHACDGGPCKSYHYSSYLSSYLSSYMVYWSFIGDCGWYGLWYLLWCYGLVEIDTTAVTTPASAYASRYLSLCAP